MVAANSIKYSSKTITATAEFFLISANLHPPALKENCFLYYD